MTITKEGYPFILASLVPGVALCAWLGAAGAWAFAPALFVICFFRLPDRKAPEGPVIVSPADGTVVEITSETLDGCACTRIGIFMTVFDVHVNFAPVAGRVVSAKHTAGKFLPADRPKVSELNEHFDLVIECAGGARVAVRQIAGLIARRIVNYCNPGDVLGCGDRIGLIRFGSRVDVVVPDGMARLQVSLGQKVRGRETVLGTVK